jgi:hypothetical protein
MTSMESNCGSNQSLLFDCSSFQYDEVLERVEVGVDDEAV